MATAYIYCVTSAVVQIAKIGFWTSSLYALYQRYITYFGRDLELIVFECDINCIHSTEIKIHKLLKTYHLDLELFYKSDALFMDFCRYMMTLSISDCCQKTERSPVKTSENVKMKKYELQMKRKLDRQQVHLQIKEYNDTLTCIRRLFEIDSIPIETTQYYALSSLKLLFKESNFGNDDQIERDAKVGSDIVKHILKQLDVNSALHISHEKIAFYCEHLSHDVSVAMKLLRIRDLACRQDDRTKRQSKEVHFSKSLSRLSEQVFQVRLKSQRHRKRTTPGKFMSCYDYMVCGDDGNVKAMLDELI